MKKILISINRIEAEGGIGSSLVNLLNELHTHYDITLLVQTSYIASRHRIPDDVKIINGSTLLHDVVLSRRQQASQALPRRVARDLLKLLVKKILRRRGYELALDSIEINGHFDLAIAYSDYTYDEHNKLCYDYYYVANHVKADKKAAWLHSDPKVSGWSDSLCKARMKAFDHVVTVSQRCLDILRDVSPVAAEKGIVVYNTYDVDRIRRMASAPGAVYDGNAPFHFCTVARAVIECKRIDRIVKASSILKEMGYGGRFDWTLVGDGKDLENLKMMAKEYCVDDIVRFAGHQDNPYPYVAQAGAFVLCSDHEGFGMSVREAQIIGTPPIVTNYDAAKEVVTDTSDGLICDNSTEGLARFLANILDNPAMLDPVRLHLKYNPSDNSTAVSQFDNLLL